MKENRKGPRMLPLAWTCEGCEHNTTFNVIYRLCAIGKVDDCTLPSGSPTPPWCRLLPKRRAIGTCGDCEHWTRADPSKYAGNMGNCASKYHADGDVVFGAEYGCIHWEAKP